MQDWNLDEFGIVVRAERVLASRSVARHRGEQLYGKRLVVVEGNRRVAALKLLKAATTGHPQSKRWDEMASGLAPEDELFKKVPVLRVSSRSDVDAFLGFRHVTGIMEWRPAEKAEYIAKLIEKNHLSYDEAEEDRRKRKLSGGTTFRIAFCYRWKTRRVFLSRTLKNDLASSSCPCAP